MRYLSLFFAVVLSFVTPATAATGVGGEITTTTWTKANGPYYVLNAITVPAGNTLTIEPGVDVIFEAYAQFIVQGQLYAIGTEADSIRFIKGSAAQWGGLTLSEGDTSTLGYVRISDSFAGGVNIKNSTRVGMTNCTIANNSTPSNDGYGYGGGIYCDASTVTLVNCTIANNSAPYAAGLYGHYSSMALTSCTIVGNQASSYHGGKGGGLYAYYSTTTLENCVVTSNSVQGGYGGGIHTSSSDVVLVGCIIKENSSAYGGGVDSYNSIITLTNCTITDNHALDGGAVKSYNSTVNLAHCTISHNSYYGGGLYASSNSITIVKNTILWGNGTREYFNTTNSAMSATYSDIYNVVPVAYPGEGNINADPLFVDAANGDYHLQAGSPCINTGDPTSPLDQDGSRADMGAFPYAHSTAVSMERLSAFMLHPNIPNPFNPSTTIRFSLAEGGLATLSVYDVSGRLVRTLLVRESLPFGAHSAVWDGTDAIGRPAASGIYLYRLTAPEGTVTRRMTLVR